MLFEAVPPEVRAEHLTRTDTVIGTPQFMPPEQLEGRSVDTSADMWALGATLYATVKGRPPFDGPSLTALIVAVLTRPLPPAVHAGPLAELLSALLSKAPGERPDAVATAERLARLRTTSGANPGPPVPTVVDRVAPGPTVPDRPLHALPTVTAPARVRRRDGAGHGRLQPSAVGPRDPYRTADGDGQGRGRDGGPRP
ncbi:hypothetical protein AB0B30_36700 [Streptomyces narbonensis]|uniref:non-specific serine/threonine protein kinase n=1 Tax=Streptomyces narbonensis TaxID=67333 RepID=A0ABV3CL43_9ACTN